MSNAPISAGPGTGLTRWLVSDPIERHYPGRARPMPDRVAYRFINGFTDTGDLPCREAWLSETEGKSEPLPDDLSLPHVYCGPPGDQIDFSCFKVRPTLVRRYLRTAVEVGTAASVGLRLGTCGRVQLWVGKDLACSHAPRSRNRPAETGVTLDLPAGRTILTVMLEDLHERDTTCFVSLVHTSGPGLSQDWPVDGTAWIAEAHAALTGLAQAERQDGTEIALRGASASRPLKIWLTGLMAVERGALWTLTPQLLAAPLAADLMPGQTEVRWPLRKPTGAGPHDLTLETEVAGLSLSRATACILTPPVPNLTGATLPERKTRAADLIARTAAADPTVALLLLERADAPERAAEIVAATLPGIERRHDCSDFNLLPLILIHRRHAARMPAPLAERLRAAILGFRYWLDAPGDDVMWFWSENHVLCFHVAEMLAAETFPDDIFTADGRKGRDRLDVTGRLHRWFDAIERDGLAEWNSAAYYPIDLLALFALRDGSRDRALADRATRLLDAIFVMMALHSSGGVPSGTQGRAYEKELLAGPATELGPVAAIAFGGPFCAGFDRASGMFCLSDYAPPALAQRFASPDSALVAACLQGHGGSGQLRLWKTAHVQLSTSATGVPGSPGHQQHVVDLRLAADPMARIWINAPGDTGVWGARRPSYLAGNARLPAVAQHLGTALLIHGPGPARLPWTNLHVGGAVILDRAAAWTWLRCGTGFAGVWTSADLIGAGASVWHAKGLPVGWVLIAGDGARTRFEAFQAACIAAGPRFDPEALTLDLTPPDGPAMRLDFTGRFTLDGARQEPVPDTPVPQVAVPGDPLRPWTLF